MERDQALAFAERWIDNWNRKDVDAILGHFATDATFTSPKAVRLTGKAKQVGREELAAYWRAAAAAIDVIRFRLDHAIWDQEAQELVVVYEATLGNVTARSCEIMRFGADGQQVSGEALYGAEL